MKNTTLFLFVCSLLSLIGCKNEETYYEKHVVFPENATLEEKVDMASRLIPTPQQYAWQQLELTAFLHFGINTFTNREWGNGKEDPKVFNPTALDAEQWVVSLKNAGFKMAILTAKHHDGFCLWPTATTDHSVKSSPWKNGQGDVVKELRDACEKHDMKFGVYLSPWDRNADCYGDSPAYNQFFIQQLTELLTNYGEIHEVWFDGACAEGPNGRKQDYDWDAYYNTITKLQPQAVMAIMGDDVRWVGNEKGLGRETEWSATALAPGIYQRAEQENARLQIKPTSTDLGGREILSRAKELYWYPSEVDVSIRPGWFYHSREDEKVKSLDHLVDIYYESVGYNSVLLLNIPPDTRGLIHENDVNRLAELSKYIQATFKDNIITDFDPIQVKPGASVVVDVKDGMPVNTLMLQEDILKGQRVEAFEVEALVDNQWIDVAEGTTIGYKRLLRFDEIYPVQFRITFTQSRNDVNLKEVAAYRAPILEKGAGSDNAKHLKKDGWVVENEQDNMAKAIDGDPLSAWYSNKLHECIVDLGKEQQVSGFVYTPVHKAGEPGTIFKYNFAVSLNGKDWTICVQNGEFSNIMHNPIPQHVSFNEKIKARYIKLTPLQEINNQQKTSVAEICLLK